ncbi:MAG: PKD domain-containing protein [Thermoplasmata archaeon]|nr:PKD domain-containing protein [Thermoplasmata archaeon]
MAAANPQAANQGTMLETPAANLTASLSASPLVGSPPLVVDFSLTVTGGSGPYRYSWSFGDGNASSTANPVHTYTTLGNYTASVAVEDSAAAALTRSLSVEVRPLPLAVALTATEGGSNSSLNATLHADVSGGEAPFLYAWEFGDGSGLVSTAPTVTHVYSTSGTYASTVRVTDGSDAVAGGQTQVTVGSLARGDSGCAWEVGVCGPLGLSVPSWAILAGVVVLSLLAVRWQTRRAFRAPHEPVALGPASDLPLAAPPEAPVSRPVPAVPPEPTLTGGEPSRIPDPPHWPSTSQEIEARPMSDRILVHLYRQGVPDPNRAVPDSFTQDGLSVALGRPQSSFARALIRLEEAGLVRAELAHVHGRARRAKTYRLTPRGESAARRLGAGEPAPPRNS